MRAVTLAATRTGRAITVEARVSSDSRSAFSIVNQTQMMSRERRDRVRAALLTSGYSWPPGSVYVNLTPRPGGRTGSGELDLGVAVAVLVASGQLPPRLARGRLFIGELGLDGSVRALKGGLQLRAPATPVEVIAPADCPVEAPPGRHIRRVATLAALDSLQAIEPSEPAPNPPLGRCGHDIGLGLG